MGVLLTLLLCLFAAAPSLDAWACKSDEGAPLSVAALNNATTPGESKRDAGSQHRCYCAGHCCPSGVAMEGMAFDRGATVADAGTVLVHTAEAVVPQAPQALERPPRA